MNTLKIHDTVEVPAMTRLVIATDGSHKGRIHSSGFISTDGRFGIQTSNYARYESDPHQAECNHATELAAISLGLQNVARKTDLTIVSDSLYALRYIEKWKQGEEQMPKWHAVGPRYDHDKPAFVALSELRNRVMKDSSSIEIEHVRGHNGNLLNEAADSLAKIGRNVVESVYDKQEARRRAVGIASGFLIAYAEQTS